jgi:high affinity Mn2+ porin
MRFKKFLFFMIVMGLAPLGQAIAEVTSPIIISNADMNNEEQSSPWSFHGQATYVMQWHPDFNAPYTGPNSLTPFSNSAQTSDVTLYLGRRLWNGAEIYINPEYDQGFGLNNTLGLAGFPSAEAYKVGSQDPYFRLPRLFLRQTFDLGGERVTLEDQPNQVATTTTANNVVVTLGKFSVVDIFDTNKYAHDPRVDFLNWTAVDAGAFDYAADAWGFSEGLAVEWNQNNWSYRSGFFALSTVPNSTNLDLSFKQYQLVEEVERRHQWNGHDGKLKALVFLSRGNFGTYEDAIAANPSNPDTSSVRSFKNRSGFAIGAEQELTSEVGAFARFSWNDGQVETVEFTDTNQAVSFGLSIKGNSWKRHQDTLGVAQIYNSLSDNAKQYLGSGGLGVLIGDQPPQAYLNYGVESISEIYYNLALTNYLNISANYQYVLNPAYNKDRGPVNIFGFRVRAYF